MLPCGGIHIQLSTSVPLVMVEKSDIQKNPNLQDDVTWIMYSCWLPQLNSVVILSLLRTPSSSSQYPVTFQQRCRLLGSFSQLCAIGEYSCPGLVLLCKLFSVGRRGWCMTRLLFPLPQLGEKVGHIFVAKVSPSFLLTRSALDGDILWQGPSNLLSA